MEHPVDSSGKSGTLGVHAGLVHDLETAIAVGGLAHYPGVTSRFVPHQHDVLVCVPPGYERDTTREYAVVYLHDGQNVFDEYPMAPFGVQWGVDTTARALMHAGAIEPLILVAVGNAGRDRIDEYTPTRDAGHDAGGLADRYGQMLAYEIKPFIDRHYRTKRDAANTGLIGSSLGGLLTLHLGLTHPAIFGKLGLMSPSVWWDDRWIVRQLVSSAGGRPDLMIWLDVGTLEKRMLRGARLLCRTLQRRGWRLGEDLEYVEVDGALHDERSWGQRIGRVLSFLFPA
jgi:predicted alpha/beta superfamily hydrolase